MKIHNIDIWHPPEDWNDALAIPINLVVKRTGENVMGRGVAKQVVENWWGLPDIVGRIIRYEKDPVRLIEVPGPPPEYPYISPILPYRYVIPFPTKYHYRQVASITLIIQSLKKLIRLIEQHQLRTILPLPGCGNGKLSPKVVIPILEKFQSPYLMIVQKEENHE